MIKHGYLVRHIVPYKTGKITEEWVINWSNLYKEEDSVTKQDVLNSFTTFNKSTDDWDVSMKIKHTLEFFDKVNTWNK